MVTTGNIIGNTIGVILKKPFVIIFWGVMMLITTLMGYMLPIFRILFEFGTIGSSNLFETLMSLIQLIYSYLSDVRIVAICVIALLLILFSIAVIGAVLMSGYLYKLHNVVNRKESHKGEFSYGVRQYFNRICLMNFSLLVIGLIVFIIMTVASVPALVITSASIGKGREMLPQVLFVDVLTGFVLFFGMMFFRIYASFWYPAAISNKEKPFKNARSITNRHFWKIVVVFTIFDVIYIAFQVLFVKVDNSLLLLVLKWFFTSVFYALFTTYIFAAFKKYSKE
ncbi:MAG: hypothetical protein GYA02_06785 [Clostridiaceae bacterium]|jgi:hypothetical protein|nr:hypothetical protein [Clostridiaceae bacterium]